MSLVIIYISNEKMSEITYQIDDTALQAYLELMAA